MFYLSHRKFDRILSHTNISHVPPLLYHPALVWDRPSRATVPFPEESVLFPLCTVWSSVTRVCSLCFCDGSKKETYSVDMPLRSKRSKRSHKSILRKGKRRNRTRRVRFLGGMVGTKWFDTPLGPMTESAKRRYDEQRHSY
jgi:hypothetical protein